MANGSQLADIEAPFKTIIEPFRMKLVEVMKISTRKERLKLLAKANYNLFKIPAEYCLIDLLTDSGEASIYCSNLGQDLAFHHWTLLMALMSIWQ